MSDPSSTPGVPSPSSAANGVATPGRTGRTGLWLVGARGSVATCVAYGVHGMRRGLVPPVGLPSAFPPLDALDLIALDDLVLGGHDVCTRDLSASAGELVSAGILPEGLVSSLRDDSAAYESAIRPGLLDTAETGFSDLDPRAASLGSLPPRKQVAALTGDLDEFEKRNELDRTVVVYVASTEASTKHQAAWESLDDFEAALDAGVDQPASVVYAYAALSSGRPFVNFTPSLGADLPALIELAERSGVAVAGSDGKTGETLLKTVLAPMFKARALKVLAWQGYNMLGNRDGEVLREPAHQSAKLRTKDEALRSILEGEVGASSDELHSKVAIDYVPSLGDWKTAWDFVHFEGFFGTRMSLQFTWSGCDSALAAPLVIDLVRLVDRAQRRGEGGVQRHLGAYFKSPLGGGTHEFHRQMEALERWVRASR